MKFMKRSVSLLLCCMMIFSNLQNVKAETITGSCGGRVTFSLNTSTGVLTISGTGPMSDYNYHLNSPFYNIKDKVKMINIESGVTRIGRYVFSDCTSLTSITIPNSVTSIGDYAFFCCSGLTSITIPDGVTSIENYTFYGCDSLTSMTIPNSVTSIGDYAFYRCKSLTSMTIPNSVISIGERAFNNCSSLTSITISDSVTSIGVCAFSGCSSLTSITIPDSVTSIGVGAFSGCSSLTSIKISDNVTRIGGNTFSDCTSLTSITIPNSVTSIGDYAFSNCTSLTSITIPDSVKSFGNNVFNYCSNLDTITVDSNNPVYDSRDNCNAIIETTKNILVVGCKSTIIPNSVTSIGNYAFGMCTSLTSITIPDSVTSIGNDAFFECSSLTSITIPDNVTSIGERAFSSCSNLDTITVDSNNPVYDSRDNCNAIIETTKNILVVGCKSTIIPNSVTSIGNYAFGMCTSLTSITIPDSVTSIGNYAFWTCKSLILSIPNSVTTIGTNAFYNVSKVVIKCDNTTIGSGTYGASSIIKSHYVNDGTIHSKCIPFEIQGTCRLCGEINAIEIIPASGHDYEYIEMRWSEDNRSAQGYFVCKNDEEHTLLVDAEMTSEILDNGNEEITATVKYEGKNYTDKKTIVNQTPVNYVGTSLDLDGIINMNFYFKVPEEYEGAYAVLKDEMGNRTEVDLSTVPYSDKNGYKVTYPNIVAKRMMMKIELTVCDKDGNVISMERKGSLLPNGTFSYCVTDYVNDVLMTSSRAYSKDLAYAILNYGQCAQEYFGYETDKPMPNPLGYLGSEMGEVEADPQYTQTGPEWDQYIGASLDLEGAISSYLYFRVPITATMVKSNGEESALPVVQNANGYRVEIRNIAAKRLHEMYTIRVKYEGKTYEYRTGVFSYVNRVLIPKPEANKSNLGKAFYLYNKAARLYFNY